MYLRPPVLTQMDTCMVYRLYATLGAVPNTLYILFYVSRLLTQEPAKLFIQVECVCVWRYYIYI